MVIRADHSTTLGCFVVATMERRTYVERDLPRGPFGREDLTDFITIQVNAWQFKTLGGHLSDAHILQINRMLENSFIQHLYMYVHARVHQDGRYRGYKEQIEAFCLEHGIMPDADVAFDTLKKKESRYRAEIEKNKKELAASLCLN